ncbi:MAG: hypothetical protein ACREN7_09880 [Candidatus Dormibacteria bacterium]
MTHEVVVQSAAGSFVVQEVDPLGEMCIAYRSDGAALAKGTARSVVATASGLDPEDPWVSAVVCALERERGWRAAGSGWGRRGVLELQLGRGRMYHVAASANRQSIRKHGLDWRLMKDAPGVAGGTRPELPGIFLLADGKSEEFFARMARFPTDAWEVDVEALWLESGPGGWWLVSSPIGPERLALLPPRRSNGGL